jgi:hypothetical protein
MKNKGNSTLGHKIGLAFSPTSSLTTSEARGAPRPLQSVPCKGHSALNPWFITGFSDAEGCFSINIFKDKLRKQGFGVKAVFQLGTPPPSLIPFF